MAWMWISVIVVSAITLTSVICLNIYIHIFRKKIENQETVKKESKEKNENKK